MEINENIKEIIIVVLASLILALTVSFQDTAILYSASIIFFIIISSNLIAKKIAGYFFEIKTKIKFWSLYQYGFKKGSHFKMPLPMAWLPLILSLLTKGLFWWLAILEFDVQSKAERASKRHGLYRYTQVTEWHIAWIAVWGIITNIVLAFIGYLAGYELFAKLSIYFSLWSIIPLSSLDGSKIFFSNRVLWTTIFAILLILFGWALIIV
jgi:hypothetical protein